MLLMRKLERRRDAWRVEFVCGFRALAAARGDFSTLTQAASLLSCGLPDVPTVVTKTLEERRAQHGAAKRMEERLAEFEARALGQQAATGAGGARMVSAVLDDASPAYLGLLAAKIVVEANVIALLAGHSSGHVVFAQTKGGGTDMGSLLREVLREFGGKGGGQRDFAQGSVPKPSDVDAVISRAKEGLAGRLGAH
jgi:alanyl-tRNA synthetase